MIRSAAVALLLFGGGEAAVAQTDRGSAVAARDLPRGVTLTVSDIRYLEPAEGGAAEGDAVGPGWITRRSISGGEPLRVPAVGRPVAIRSGESVVAIYRNGGVEIRVRGTAMGTASEGEKVTVRIDPRRRVEGIAASAGVVHIEGGAR